MDRTWMSKNRCSEEYISGVTLFINQAILHYGVGRKIRCSCLRCGNIEKVSDEQLRHHLFEYGIVSSYTRWIWHGEADNVRIQSDKKDEDQEGDRLEDMIHDAMEYLHESGDGIEALLSDAKKPVYSGCSKFSKLSSVVKLYNLKVVNGWSDKSFTALLELLKEMLPSDNVLPSRTYEAEKMLSHIGMSYLKIHACRNDCVLYRNEYANEIYCPTCKAPRYKKGKVPAKVLWYFPIIPRLLCMFAIPEVAKNLTWYENERIKDGKLRHPADSPQWRYIDAKFPAFASESRNIRLALSADGVCPYDSIGRNYSMWPVLMSVYNLPPALCMKRKYMMLSLLISGPKQPGNDIDVYLAPLVEDLQKLWEVGVDAFDAYKQETFNLKALLFCTINDFPAYGNLSGYTTKGHYACPICEQDTQYMQLPVTKKTVYMVGRTFLPHDHQYRRQKRKFNGEVEEKAPPIPLNGQQVYERVKDIDLVFGKKCESGKKRKVTAVNGWKKQSIFFSLPYWKMLFVRHCLDLMHIEKNVCDSIIGTLLNTVGKTKDGIKSRRDLDAMGIRPELKPILKGNRHFMPPACYTLSRQKKKDFLEFLSEVKVPTGYSSNIKNLVSMTDSKLVGLKSHDCHILMQELLPIALRGILPKRVRFAITRLCFFFKAICSKVIDPNSLNSLQSNIIYTLCELEMYFPPSFFDIMVHLVVHLVREVRLCGPVYLRWMYPFERFMKVLKSYIMNKYRPEGSIAERYIAEEAVEFCSEYLPDMDTVGVPAPGRVYSSEGEGISAAKIMSLSSDMHKKAHLYVLHNIDEVEPYIEDHKNLLRGLNPKRTETWIVGKHNNTFIEWFKQKVSSELENSTECVSEKLKWLSYGPRMEAFHYIAYAINGYTFYTKERDEKSPMQNSGVTLIAQTLTSSAKYDNLVYKKVQYYGVVDQILELEYTTFKVPVFACNWVHESAVNTDDLGFTLVDLSKSGYIEEPFIFASQAKQVFFVPDPSNKKLSVVLSARKRYPGEEVEHDEDDIVDGNICSKVPIVDDDDSNDGEMYVRKDHNEGTYVKDVDIDVVVPSKKQKKRKKADEVVYGSTTNKKKHKKQ